MEDPYAAVAERYDLFFERLDAYRKAEVAFFRDVLGADAPRRVLDCACGTGRYLPLLHSLGYDVVGMDISPAMLDRARRNLDALGLDIPLHQGDMAALPAEWRGAFDAVTCLSSSLLHVPNEAALARVLRSMAGVLRPGGLLVLTQGTSDRQAREKPRFLLARDDAVVTRLFAIDYRPPGATYHVLDVYHGPERKGLEVWSTEYARLWLRDDYARLFERTGYTDVAFYGAYDRAPYDAMTSHRLIGVAHRPGPRAAMGL